MARVFTMHSASMDGYVSGKNARPGNGLGTGGHPFFHHLPDAIQLECTSVAVNTGVVHLTYRVLK